MHKYGTGFLTLGGSGFLSRQKVITGSLELSGSFSVVRIKLPTRGRLLVVAAGRLGGGGDTGFDYDLRQAVTEQLFRLASRTYLRLFRL